MAKQQQRKDRKQRKDGTAGTGSNNRRKKWIGGKAVEHNDNDEDIDQIIRESSNGDGRGSIGPGKMAMMTSALIGFLAVAAGCWHQREHLLEIVADLPSLAEVTNSSWQMAHLLTTSIQTRNDGDNDDDGSDSIVHDDNAAEGNDLTDEQLRDLAKFWSENSNTNSNTNNNHSHSNENDGDGLHKDTATTTTMHSDSGESQVETDSSVEADSSADTTTSTPPSLSTFASTMSVVEMTAVSIAPYHDMTIPGKDQKEDMIKYMHFDDGYTTCINVDDLRKDPNLADVLQLKHSKFLLRQRMANIPERWAIQVPRPTEASPVDASLFQNLLPTCRLLTLTQEEFDGKASKVLHDALHDESKPFVLDKKLGNASEFRTMVCLARLIDEFLRIIPDKVPRAAMESLKQSWSGIAKDSYRAAVEEPLPPLAEGWTELRNDKSNGHAYYIHGTLGVTSWVRPIPEEGIRRSRKRLAAAGEKQEVDPTLKRSSLISRSTPCQASMSEWLLGNK